MPRRELRLRRRVVRHAALILVGMIGLVGVVSLIGLLVWRVPPLLYQYVPDLNQRAAAEASTRTGFIAGLAGLAALGGLAVTSRTYRLTQQGQITDRYTKAVEQLGGDKLDVRLGGIYALERIAVDSKRDHQTIVEVLSAMVRERTDPLRIDKPILSEESELRPRPAVDVQAACTVLGRLPHRNGVSRGDLGGAVLVGVRLVEANLSGADLLEADLSGAWLHDADLSGVQLQEAILSVARMQGTNLSGACLIDADLSFVYLPKADLSGACLGGANLSSTQLHEADLSRADLSLAQLHKADLSGANGLTQEQLDAAKGDATTRLPDGLQRPSAWVTDGGRTRS